MPEEVANLEIVTTYQFSKLFVLFEQLQDVFLFLFHNLLEYAFCELSPNPCHIRYFEFIKAA